MMGSGKSTIGLAVAKKLGLVFVDIDKEIESRENLTIKQIFEKKGEIYFRKLEQLVCFEKLKRKNLTIALGGGSFINPMVRKKILSDTLSFWLDVNIENLIKRKINFQKRPLINKRNEKKLRLLKKIYNDRKTIYNLAKFRINCNKQDKFSIINQICDIYEAN